MATKHQTLDKDLQKRMNQLRQQVYGKPTTSMYTLPTSSNPSISETQNSSDMAYLKTDLLKIFILTSFALAAQFGLHYALNQNLIKLPI